VAPRKAWLPFSLAVLPAEALASSPSFEEASRKNTAAACLRWAATQRTSECRDAVANPSQEGTTRRQTPSKSRIQSAAELDFRLSGPSG